MTMDRKRLTEIIETDYGNNWWKPNLFESKIRHLLPAEVNIVAPPPEEADNYNCFVFAFGLQSNHEFLGGKNPIQQEFVKHLIFSNTLIATLKPLVGDFVFYKNNNDEITHGGIMQNSNSVISKWMWGPIVAHALFDVPSSFGDDILFFKAPNVSDIKEEYYKYKNTGVYIQPIE